MYIPPYYKNEDPKSIREFLKQHEFAVLVNQVEGKLWATHIPLQLGVNNEGKEVLYGHVARSNPQWKSFKNNPEVMAVFQGPHSYISSSWYDHENVPTWNYQAIHVYGHARLLTNEELWQVLNNLVDSYELHSEKPVKLEEISPKYVKNEMRGIKGFEIEITDIQAQFKLSQGHSANNRERVIEKLQNSKKAASTEIAVAMKKFAPED